jgi:hypothetical protein
MGNNEFQEGSHEGKGHYDPVRGQDRAGRTGGCGGKDIDTL